MRERSTIPVVPGPEQPTKRPSLLTIALVFAALAIPGMFVGGYFGSLCGMFTGDAGIGESAVATNIFLYTLLGAIIGAGPAILWLIGSFCPVVPPLKRNRLSGSSLMAEAGGRLNSEELVRNFADLPPPLTGDEVFARSRALSVLI